MTEEEFQTYDEAGNPLSLALRSEVHRLGLWHRAANVLLFRSNGELILQRRADAKDVCPGLWDLSVAEHLKPGESFLDAAHRGLQEELGLEGVELHTLGEVIRVSLETPGVRDREFQQTFQGVSDSLINADPAEVAETVSLPLALLQQQLQQSPDRFTPWLRRTASAVQLFD